jgi:hypothetical protein
LENIPEEYVAGHRRIPEQVYQITLGVPRTGEVTDSESDQFIRLFYNMEALRHSGEYLVALKGVPQLISKIPSISVSVQDLAHPRHPFGMALKLDGITAWYEYLSITMLKDKVGQTVVVHMAMSDTDVFQT